MKYTTAMIMITSTLTGKGGACVAVKNQNGQLFALVLFSYFFRPKGGPKGGLIPSEERECVKKTLKKSSSDDNDISDDVMLQERRLLHSPDDRARNQ